MPKHNKTINLIGHRLRWLRIEKGLTLREMAEKLGVAAQTISNYERGANMPKSPMLIALAKFFKCKTSFFFVPMSEIIASHSAQVANQLKKGFAHETATLSIPGQA
jgi:transcriptional regulator with XRE-family HTH domain